ncbi:MAG: permease-like cell division protein FtsX, partial [Clostridia bacterium]
MKTRTLGRHVREGVKNLGRNGWMTFASISAVTITLFILGVFLLLAFNVNHIAQSIEKQVEIRVFLDLLADKPTVEQVGEKLKALPKVESVQFVSKEEGMVKFKDSMGEKSYLLDGLEKENPFPDSYVVKTKLPQDTASVAKLIQEIPSVSSVNYGEGTVEKLFVTTKMVRNVGIVFIVGLSFTAMFLIANTIKLTIVARRREIEIMKLVGATNWFIRWPFFVEGLTMGLVGALIPIVILGVGYYYLLDSIDLVAAIPFFKLL